MPKRERLFILFAFEGLLSGESVLLSLVELSVTPEVGTGESNDEGDDQRNRAAFASMEGAAQSRRRSEGDFVEPRTGLGEGRDGRIEV